MGNLIFVLGMLIFVVGGFLFLVAAFRESILWGLACLFLPIIPLFFLIVHWQAAKKPFFIQLTGFAVLVVGAVISPQTFRG